jgi:short-subunit dehydrogenase
MLIMLVKCRSLTLVRFQSEEKYMSGTNALGTAVVTGASSGIGKVYAQKLAQRGFDLILVARRAERLSELAEQLKAKHGVTVTNIVADLSKSEDLERVAQTLESDSSITLLVNNAGTSVMGLFVEAKPRRIADMLHVNVLALTRLALAVLPGFRQRDRGTLINIGSVLGYYGYPGTSSYSGTKAYVLTFTRGLQAEVAGSNVKVQLVAPAGTATEGWDSTTVDSSIVMTAEDCVDASLKGLDMQEPTTLPSVEDLHLLANYETAAGALMGASQTGKPANRYTKTQ